MARDRRSDDRETGDWGKGVVLGVMFVTLSMHYRVISVRIFSVSIPY